METGCDRDRTPRQKQRHSDATGLFGTDPPAKPISGQRHMPAASTGRTHDRKQCSRQKSPRQPLQTQGRPHMTPFAIVATGVSHPNYTPERGRRADVPAA